MTSWKKAYEHCKAQGKTLREPLLENTVGDQRSLLTMHHKMIRQEELTEQLDYITFLGLYYDDKVSIHSHFTLLLG